MKKIKLRANGKINLGLDVLSKRPDGYHELQMIMQTVNLCDYITIERRKSKGIKVYSNVNTIPCNENNLAYKAAKLLMEEASDKNKCKAVNSGINIHIQKNIPIAAGMAGGSADAAAVLRGINILFELGFSQSELKQLGLKLGADVPYCIKGGTMLAEGIGEVLTPIECNINPYVLIAKPDISLSTAYIYGKLNCDDIITRPRIDNLANVIRNGNIENISNYMGNVLEEVAIKEYPVIQEIKDNLIKYGAIAAMVSGSGPTVFGLFSNSDDIKSAERKLRKKHVAKQIYITTFAKGIKWGE